MGQSAASAKCEPGFSGRQAANTQSASVSINGADSTSAYEISVSGQTVWTDAGIELRRGDRILLTAMGTIQFSSGQIVGPEGTNRVSTQGPFASLPLSNAPRRALVARIGEADVGMRLAVGKQKRIEVPSSGRLYLRVNEHVPGEAFGSFKVHAEIQSRAAKLASQSDSAVAALILPQIREDSAVCQRPARTSGRLSEFLDSRY